jgi:hypothetical protein
MELKETGYEDVDWIHLAKNNNQSQPVVNMIMILTTTSQDTSS